MRRILPVVLSLLALPLWSQTLPQFLSIDTATITCPNDTNVSILTYTNWEAYQTLNDAWDGPRDTTRCIHLAHVVGAQVLPRIWIDQVDTMRSVFVRALLDTTNAIPLDSNELYAITAGYFESISGLLDVSGTCANGLCSGLLAAVRIPDSTGMGYDLRWYQKEHDSTPWLSSIELCMPTERFASNRLVELIFKMTFQNATPGSDVRLFDPYEYPMIGWGMAWQLAEANMPQFNWGQFNYELFNWPPNFMVMYEDSTYPSADHYSYLDLAPIPNIPIPDTVHLVIPLDAGLVYQPFTQFRGDLVDGSTTQRHFLEVEDHSNGLCLSNAIVELVWEGEVRYTHHGGSIDFEGERSCFLVGKGGALAVDNNATLYYGHNGKGMLALKTGARLEIRPGAELVMGGTIVMYEYEEDMTPQDVYMTLPQGAKLTFAPGSHITNQWSIGQDMKLYVYLDGGSVDLGTLSPAERDMIVLVPLPTEPLDEIQLHGNPVGDQLVFETGAREAGSLQVRVTDALGRTLLLDRLAVDKGPKRVELDLHFLRAGNYFLETSAFGIRRTARFVKQ